MAPKEPLERRQIARAVGRIAVRGFPDRIQAREDHLGELVDVALPRSVVVAHHHQPPAVVDDEPLDEVNRADADERAGRRQPLRVRIDRRHHGADAVDLSRLTTVTSVSWFCVTTSSLKVGGVCRSGPDGTSSPGTSGTGTAQLSSAHARVRRSLRRHAIAA